jgi:hypothetical protein
MMTKWYYGHGEDEQTPEHAPNTGFDSVRQYWIGRSCGCKLRTLEVDKPKNTTGIVVYPGHRFTEESTQAQVIKHIDTKNGPLTICSSLEYRK